MQITTTVSGMRNDELHLRAHALSDLVGSLTFSQTVFYACTSSIPDDAQLTVFDALLVASIDHGAYPATGFVPRAVAASGNGTTHALAAGILAIGDRHGGAVEHCMRVLKQLRDASPDTMATYVREQREARQRIPGFGHKKYTSVDPRSEQLLQLAERHNLAGAFVATARTLESALEQELGRKLVLNIDGTMAALLLELGMPEEAGNGIFALARMGGMLAQVIEERQSHADVYRLEDSEVAFTG